EVVAEAGDGEAAVQAVLESAPDVLLTDLVMPGIDGIEVIRRLRAADAPVGILVLTSFSGADQVIPAIKAGADGYLLKDAGPGALADAIRAVHRGDAMLAPEVAAVVMARLAGGEDGDDAAGPAAPATAAPAAEHPDLARLTPREREVLAGLGRGLTNRQLAEELYVSEKTVKTHVSSILAKLRLTDRTQAALFAVRAGLADPRRPEVPGPRSRDGGGPARKPVRGPMAACRAVRSVRATRTQEDSRCEGPRSSPAAAGAWDGRSRWGSPGRAGTSSSTPATPRRSSGPGPRSTPPARGTSWPCRATSPTRCTWRRWSAPPRARAASSSWSTTPGRWGPRRSPPSPRCGPTTWSARSAPTWWPRSGWCRRRSPTCGAAGAPCST